MNVCTKVNVHLSVCSLDILTCWWCSTKPQGVNKVIRCSSSWDHECVMKILCIVLEIFAFCVDVCFYHLIKLPVHHVHVTSVYVGFCHGSNMKLMKVWHWHCLLFCLHVAVSPAAERLRHILGEDDSTPTPTLFTEMDTLQHEGGELEWKESARYTLTLTLTYTQTHTGVRAFISLGFWVTFDRI